MATEAGDASKWSDASESELLDRVLEREQRTHWTDAPEVDAILQQRHVAIGTMLGADSEEEAIAHLSHRQADMSPMEATRIALWLNRLYEGPRWVNPLEPDLLGEHLVSEHLDRQAVEYLLTLPATSASIQGFSVLARIAARRPDLRQLIGDALAKELPELGRRAAEQAETSTGGTDSDLMSPLSALVEQLDFYESDLIVPARTKPSLSGNRFASALAEQALAHARERTRRDPTRDASTALAQTLSTSADWLADIGDIAGSIDRLAEAVSLRRELATDGPTTAKAALAAALNNLSHRAREVARHDVALSAIKEATEIRRALSEGGHATQRRRNHSRPQAA